MEQINAQSIFSPATGFIRRCGFDWTCNPYLGCSFGCTYCYAMFLPQNRRPKEDWGRWVQAKINAVTLAQKQGPKVSAKSLYLSSVTDPYVPAEKGLRLTRGILESLITHQPRLLIQTRGPLVVRDIDLLTQFRSVRINMSIPTDSDSIRKIFEPKAPLLDRRWQALSEAKDAGLAVGVCLTPLLPLDDPDGFIEKLVRFEPDVLVVQNFHESLGSFGASTGEKAKKILQERRWSAEEYSDFVTRLRRKIPAYEGEAGFFPPP